MHSAPNFLSQPSLDVGVFITKNGYLQAALFAIKNAIHQVVARYIYDAWGKHKVLNPNWTENTSSSFIGNINPYRYRSYYYDTDLKMYWLETRYYDPEICRFISPDHYSYLDYQKLHGLNLYAYSKNNPVMYCDPSGHFVIGALTFAITTIATLFATATSLVSTILPFMLLSADDTKTTGSAKKDVPNGELGKDYFEHPLSDGKTIVQFSFGDVNSNLATNSLKIYNSSEMSCEQIVEFLEYLISIGYTSINIERVRNEWAWHKIGYILNIMRDSARSVDVFFDADDVNHGIFSWIINHCRLW